MSPTQLEHADATRYSDPLPCESTLDRLEQLFTDRRREMILAKNRRIRLAGFDERFADENWQISDGRIRLANEVTQAELRLAGIEGEIVNVARMIVGEADNSELLCVCDCLNREQRRAEAEADAEMRVI